MNFSTPRSACSTQRLRTASRSPRNRRVSTATALPLRLQAKHTVPTGFSADGLPLGMQIAARSFDEAMLYRVAQAFCAATGLTARRPVLPAAAVAAQ